MLLSVFQLSALHIYPPSSSKPQTLKALRPHHMLLAYYMGYFT